MADMFGGHQLYESPPVSGVLPPPPPFAVDSRYAPAPHIPGPSPAAMNAAADAYRAAHAQVRTTQEKYYRMISGLGALLVESLKCFHCFEKEGVSVYWMLDSEMCSKFALNMKSDDLV